MPVGVGREAIEERERLQETLPLQPAGCRLYPPLPERKNFRKERKRGYDRRAILFFAPLSSTNGTHTHARARGLFAGYSSKV